MASNISTVNSMWSPRSLQVESRQVAPSSGMGRSESVASPWVKLSFRSTLQTAWRQRSRRSKRGRRKKLSCMSIRMVKDSRKLKSLVLIKHTSRELMSRIAETSPWRTWRSRSLAQRILSSSASPGRWICIWTTTCSIVGTNTSV